MIQNELNSLASHVKEMRDLQQAYFAARKGTRWPDKKILEASKAKEREVDSIVQRILSTGISASPSHSGLMFNEDQTDIDPY